MNQRILLSFIVAAAGTAASADDFSWKTGVVGPWSNANNWNGPGVPNNVADNAFIGGGASRAYLDFNTDIGNLTVSSGAELFIEYLGPSHLVVEGETTVDGLDSMIKVPDSSSIFTDELTLSDWGQLLIEDGYVRSHQDAWIGDNGYIKGVGVVNIGTDYDLILAPGADIIASSDQPGTLKFLPFGGTNARIDWDADAWRIRVGPDHTLQMMLKPAGVMNGVIDIADGGTFETQYAWIAGPNSFMEIGGDAEILGGPMDVYGTFRVTGDGAQSTVNVALSAFRGDVQLGNPDLFFDGNVILNGADVTATEGTQGNVRFGPLASTLTVRGQTIVSTPGMFDLDGENGALHVIVDEDAEFVLDAGAYDVPNNPFDGHLTLEGSALFTSIFINNDLVTMDGGTFFGNTIYNDGRIEGAGNIVNTVLNNNEIVASGGTLQLSSTSTLDGGFETGHVKVIDGDLVLAGDEDQHFNGSMWVGNGAAIREVFDMDGELTISQDFGIPGSLALNGGRVNAKSISLESEFTNQGDSILSTFGGQGNEIAFRDGSTNTIDGLLTLWQFGVVEAGASFSGSGTLATQSNRTINLRDGANTGSVDVHNAGTATLEGPQTGHVEVGAFSQEPGATYWTTIAAGGHDRLISDTTVELAGTLHVGVTNGFVPQAGASYTIMQAENVSGSFDAVTTDPEIGRAIVEVTDTDVIITVTCAADMNGDGVLNILDFVTFQQMWEAGDPAGDCDNNGVFNILDFVCFQTLFNLGC